MVDVLIRVIGGALLALAQRAPDIAAAFTGGQDPKEAIEAARAAARGIPVRTGPGGTWAADRERRLRRDDGEIDPRL